MDVRWDGTVRINNHGGSRTVTGAAASVLSNQQGQYRTPALAPGRYQVTSRHGRLLEPVTFEVDADTKPSTHDITMQRPAFELHGVVSDDHRQPVAKAEVSLIAGEKPVTLRSTSDVDGSFSLYAQEVPPVPFTIKANASNLEPRTLNDMWPGQLVQIVLRSGVLMTVQVVDDHQQPVSNFGIRIVRASDKATLLGRDHSLPQALRPGSTTRPHIQTMWSGHHPHGRLTVRLPRDQYILFVEPTGARYASSRLHDIHLLEDNKQPLEITVPRTVRVEFQVHFNDGTWVEQATLRATGTGPDAMPVHAKAKISNGQATLRLPRRVKVDLQVTAYNIEDFRRQDFVAETDDAKLRIPSGAAVIGTVYPVYPGHVQLRRSTGEPRTWPKETSHKIDKEGRFWFSHVPNGHWELWFTPSTAMKPAYKMAMIADLKEGERRRISCDGRQGGKVTLDVLLTLEGKPASRRFFTLRPLSEDGSSNPPPMLKVGHHLSPKRLMTDHNGKIRQLVGLMKFSIDVDIQLGDLGTLVVPAQPEVLPIDTVPQAVQITTAPMTILLEDGNGRPIKDRRLKLSTGVGEPLLLPVSDPEGFVHLAKVPCVRLQLLSGNDDAIVATTEHRAGAPRLLMVLPD